MPSKPLRPEVFIGSSSTIHSKSIAYAIQQNLDEDAEITVWDQNVFKLTKSTLESLLEQLRKSKFAIFVFSPDDILHINGKTLPAVRDNLIFEIGLFMGHLGQDHTFMVMPKKGRLRIPSDLLGISYGRFNSSRKDKNIRAALAPFCHEVRLELQKLGFGKKTRRSTKQALGKHLKSGLQILEALYGARDHRVNVAHKLNSLMHKDRLHVYVGNQLVDDHDPCPGTKKDIRVKYSYRGIEETVMVPERGDLDLPPKSEFIEVFAQELQNWEYEGAWAIENKNELLVTNSEYGGVAWQCLNWKDYSFEFDTKICNKFTSWIVRAQNARTYVMLQCHPTRIYPHFCVNKHWTKIEWTGQNPLKLPITLPIDTWFHVRIEVKNFDVTITFLIDGKDYSVPTIKDLLQPPIAPIEYGIGSIGFRCSGDEAAFFRNISVHMI